MSTSVSTPPLIARTALFGNPAYSQTRLSPDGKKLAWLAPKDGVLNIWSADIDNIDGATPITSDTGRGIRFYSWARNNTHLLYMQDEGGDEDWHLFSVDMRSGDSLDLTPIKGVNAQLEAMSWEQPDILIAAINDRDASWHDLYTINIVTAERTLLFLNNRQFGQIYLDHALKIRLAHKSLEEGGHKILICEGETWNEFLHVPFEEEMNSKITGFDGSNEAVYMISSEGRNTAGLFRIDLSSGDKTLLGEHDQADVGQIINHPTNFTAQAYSVNYLKPEWHTLSSDIEADLDYLHRELEGEVVITSRTKDDQLWTVAQHSPRHPGTSYLYDRTREGSLTKLFDMRPQLADTAFAPMQALVIKTRDGLELPSYLTLPLESAGDDDTRPTAPVPLVLLVHGGPWARDVYGFNTHHQWLANRGYAVLSVNFRGSTGFGKEFVNAGDKEWGRKMHDDLVDAVEWAIGENITRAGQVAIMGGSYGGYATLVGLTFTPELFCCGVDIVGPSNLQTLMETIPPYWKSFFDSMAKRVGDPRTEDGRALLQERSPLHSAEKIVKPLLIGQGANDPRVKQAESDQIVTAMKAKSLPVIYALYPDEGHGFARPENRLSFNALTELFFERHLGGRAEPMGDARNGASLELVEGGEFVDEA